MALIKCKECGKKISKDAEVCPHCGKINKPHWLLNIINWLVRIVILCIFWIIWAVSNTNTHNTSYKEEMNNISNLSLGKEDIDISKKLQIELSPNMMQDIESMEIEKRDNGKVYSAIVYLKTGHIKNYREKAYIIVRKILKILIDEGCKPFDDNIFVSVFMVQRVKGETGQNMGTPLGWATYNYYRDMIEWKSWTGKIF